MIRAAANIKDIEAIYFSVRWGYFKDVWESLFREFIVQQLKLTHGGYWQADSGIFRHNIF